VGARQDLYDSVQVTALAAVVKGTDPNYVLRRIFRWYSEKFHTPLHRVEDLPVHDVLQNYYEAQYEAMLDANKFAELDEERRRLMMTDADWLAARRAVDEEEADAAEFAQVVAEEEAQAALPPAPPPPEALPPGVHINFEGFDEPDLDQDPLGIFTDDKQSSDE
jgi:hypothetical protein